MLQKFYRGFTLIELLFSMAVFTTLCLLSVPALEIFFNRHYHYNEADRFFHTLQFVRSEAIKRQQKIALCPSSDSQHCDLNWAKGYIVYVVKNDSNENKPLEILRVHTNSRTSQIYSPSLRTIEYTAEGRCLSRGSIYIEGDRQHKIVLYDSGRARMALNDGK